MRFKTLSVVIPVFNEEGFIDKTIQKVTQANIGDIKKEIIIVDDASTDSTVHKITSYIAKSKKNNLKIKFNLIKRKINQGKGAALRDGFLKTSGDIVIVQDADLEYSPDEYSKLLEPFLTHDADVVYGSRFVSGRPHRILYFWHSLANTILTFFSNMFTNLNLTDMETGFKLFKGDLIRRIAPELESKRFGFEPEITARIAKIPNLKLYEVGVSYLGRTYVEGKKVSWKDGVLAIWEIVKFNLFR